MHSAYGICGSILIDADFNEFAPTAHRQPYLIHLERALMTTFTTEDRELVEKEPIPFYGHCDLTAPNPKDAGLLLCPELKKIKEEFRVDDGSEDLED